MHVSLNRWRFADFPMDANTKMNAVFRAERGTMLKVHLVMFSFAFSWVFAWMCMDLYGIGISTCSLNYRKLR